MGTEQATPDPDPDTDLTLTLTLILTLILTINLTLTRGSQLAVNNLVRLRDMRQLV